jgi:uncharacterized repeat protein (TIGR03803 family)
MKKNFEEPAKRLVQCAKRRRPLRKFVIGLAGVALVCGGGIAAWADWTPPESSVTPPAVLTLNAFTGTNGAGPSGQLVMAPDGQLYGLTLSGGAFHRGTLFRVDASGTFTNLHDFDGTNGGNFGDRQEALALGPDGALYGPTAYGGAYNNSGTLFRLETNGTFAKLHDFTGTDGVYPQAALVVGPDGALYGSAGTLFRWQTYGTFTMLHRFNGTDGSGTVGGLVVGPDGALYGSTDLGGTGGTNGYGYGTLFRLETNGTFTNLHDFNGTDGRGATTLVVGPDGAMYGCSGGGTNNHGTLFRLETNGTFTKLHDFTGIDGVDPYAAQVVGPDGGLYGSTDGGGTNGKGTLFRLQTNGSLTKLHDFNGTDGYGATTLVVGPDGAMYGCSGGGANGYGTLFRLQTNGTFTKLHDFNGTNGANPSTALVVGPDGALYGSTPKGGGGGVLFKVVINRPPVARCHDVTVSAGANCVADASVDNGSFDPDAGDTITLRQEPPGPYPLGATPVMLTVTDNRGGSNSCMATVTVMDTTPPTIGDVTVTEIYGMVEVTLNYTAMDDCAGVTNTLTVTSNERPKERDDESEPDWVVEDDHHVLLRAGGGTGRVYTITIISTDNAGNSSTRTTTVTVPKSQGK